MNRSLQEHIQCNINEKETKYTEWSTDVKLFSLKQNSHKTTTLETSPYEMVFKQIRRKPIVFTANISKNAQCIFFQPAKNCLPLYTRDEDHFIARKS